METQSTALSPAPGTVKAYYKTLEEKLKLAKIAIDNALLVSELSAPLAARGYSNLSLLEALALYQKAENSYQSQKAKYGDKLGATDYFDALSDELHETYSEHLALAKIILKNKRGDLEKLQANGKRKSTISGWIGQVKTFYTNALDSIDIRAALATKGISEAELRDTQDKVIALEKKEAAKYDKKGDAQLATSHRDDVIDELLEWHKDFVETAKITFRRTPQLLEKLGITVKR